LQELAMSEDMPVSTDTVDSASKSIRTSLVRINTLFI